ncbi:chromosomal replication initiator protein DnaA [Candidatus Roizmanbacteria bacterium]|nr:chromosomal replication initiator protein DnaA [Candidatus Roizmanbacteria bacterium]
MASLHSIWEDFLSDIETNKKESTVVLSLLKHMKPLTMEDSILSLLCENQGVRIYLEKKKLHMEQMMSSFIGKKITIEFVVEERKKREAAPLLEFEPSTEDLLSKAGLHPKYNFDNFAVSSSNQVAYAAAQSVAQTPGHSYNPLFLYGGVGVGKTHLAQSVARTVLERNHDKKVFFCPGDQFTNELIESIREKSTPKFRRKYRGLDLLIVDDIQFIAGKQTVQEEFFHTFNSVVSAHGQIILTSDRPPSEIKNLEDRLRSRFSGGLIVDMQEPDFELRTAILLIKAKEKNIEIDIEAAKILAEHVSDSRALEGALISLYAKTLGTSERIDLETVELFFHERVERTVTRTSSGDIIKAVCNFYNLKQSHLKSATRTEEIARPRQIAMFLMRRELKLKFEEIASILKRKDHTTIMHGVEKINGLIMKDGNLRAEVDAIVQSFTQST